MTTAAINKTHTHPGAESLCCGRPVTHGLKAPKAGALILTFMRSAARIIASCRLPAWKKPMSEGILPSKIAADAVFGFGESIHPFD